ncbi:hypothetical protein GCM10023085_71250 [Actinomadura viridis]|uniref:Uncharacterized membrane protein YcaP (DUF421 family) n=1 Tax=Actinomadura viridis TaxID=58110 RepID=A0A931DIB9_9ACTN|nr:YetF domain-containing protein [Actinomadura viridis]MBG6089128.1 uncharacterized membrane protein YcaP (DUF421 family) [Actinomadura viridis]
MWWLTGGWEQLGAVAAKATLMYGTALLALRLGERRTLAQWTMIDVVAAVAVGAIVGRTAVASSQSYVTGAVALVTVVALHRVLSVARFNPALGTLLDHRIRVLVAHGRVRDDQLRTCGLTRDDLYAQLRQRGVFQLSDVRFVLYEAKGGLTVVPEEGHATSSDGLVREGLENAAGYREPDGPG